MEKPLTVNKKACSSSTEKAMEGFYACDKYVSTWMEKLICSIIFQVME